MNTPWPRRLLVVLLVPTALAGCSAFKRGKPQLDSSAGMFDKAELNYRVETAKINSAPPRLEGQLVSYQTGGEKLLPAQAVADVHIEFPHPNKREGHAQVTVRMIDSGVHDAETPWWKSSFKWTGLSNQPPVQETWVLDLPQNELASIINSLHNTGFFTSYDKPKDGARIETQLDGAKVSKTWHQVQPLDALIVRVRTQGRLLSSPKGDSSSLFQGLAGTTPSSVQAYRKLHEEEGVAMASDLDQVPAVATSPTFQVVRLPPVGGTLR